MSLKIPQLQLAAATPYLTIEIPNLSNFFNAILSGTGNFSGLVTFSPSSLDLSMSFDGLFEELNNPLHALLTNPVVLVNGLDSVLAKVEAGIVGTKGVLTKSKVPLIGNSLGKALSTGDAFFSKFRYLLCLLFCSASTKLLSQDRFNYSTQ